MSKEWFILQFKSNAHRQANKNLQQQGFETFLPLNNITSRKASRFTNVTQPLFPGYMFVKFDVTNPRWNKINSTYGVLRLITFNSILKSIPTEVIESLIKRCNMSGKLLPVKKLKKGDQVKLIEGPFANFIATIESYQSDERVWILMDLMGREAKIQSPLFALSLSD
jgi:transcriptional antiterminator RfaH